MYTLLININFWYNQDIVGTCVIEVCLNSLEMITVTWAASGAAPPMHPEFNDKDRTRIYR